jgi:pilus assembly protein Flp/PilA
MRLRSLRRSTRGATAIEYAVIAGIIGLGLVGSLVTTRGSLSAVFGTASSQMGSSDAGSSGAAPAPTASAGAGYYASKTLSGTPTTNKSGAQTTKNWTYTDGTTVSLTTGGTAPNNTVLMVKDPALKTITYTVVNAAGTLTYYSKDSYADASLTPGNFTYREDASGTQINSGGTITQSNQQTCANSVCNNLGAQAPTTNFVSTAADGITNINYYLTK